MLNLSEVSIQNRIDQDKYSIFKKLEERSVSKVLLRLLTIVSIIAILALFLPWTQNIRSDGYVTTLNPDDRPQYIQSLIDGRIESWFVQEGDIVQAGDTIIFITESKEDYLDPQLLERTESQINAKTQSADAYKQKAGNLQRQYQAALQNKDIKVQQNDIKIQQVRIKLASDSMDLEAARIKLKNSTNQLNRIRDLYEKGIKSLTDYETKTFEYQESQAKVISLENKMIANRNEITNLKANENAIINEYNEKLSKIQADRMSSLSMQYTSEGEANKLQSEYNKYKVRTGAYFLTSPITGRITKAIQTGIGEFIKSGENIVSIIPLDYELAVEMYVEPMDMPLLQKGQKVRLQFDGWPAIIFSGWPNSSYGTFGGEIWAIDNFISDNGLYRILVIEDPEEQSWPEEIMVGGGANALILLKDVRLYYELWRQLNGFPPDFYNQEKDKDVKIKAPIKRVKEL